MGWRQKLVYSGHNQQAQSLVEKVHKSKRGSLCNCKK